jgi:hypothetical protein
MPESDADRARREAAAEAERERQRALREIERETKNNRPRDER